MNKQEFEKFIKTEIGKIKEAVESCEELQGTDDVIVSFSREYNYESASCCFCEGGKQKRKFYYYKQDTEQAEWGEEQK